jgi:hypothetical protein
MVLVHPELVADNEESLRQSIRLAHHLRIRCQPFRPDNRSEWQRHHLRRATRVEPENIPPDGGGIADNHGSLGQHPANLPVAGDTLLFTEVLREVPMLEIKYVTNPWDREIGTQWNHRRHRDLHTGATQRGDQVFSPFGVKYRPDPFAQVRESRRNGILIDFQL